MRRPVLLALLLGALALPVLGQPNWTKLAPPDSGVTMEFPAEPTPTVASSNSLVGRITIRAWTTHADRCRYRFSVTDVPGIALSMAPNGLFVAARDALLHETNGTKVSFSLLSFHDFRARELVYHIPAYGGQPEKDGLAWFVLIGRRMILMDAHGPSPEYGREAQHFFSSLKVLQ